MTTTVSATRLRQDSSMQVVSALRGYRSVMIIVTIVLGVRPPLWGAEETALHLWGAPFSLQPYSERILIGLACMDRNIT